MRIILARRGLLWHDLLETLLQDGPFSALHIDRGAAIVSRPVGLRSQSQMCT